MPLLLNVPTFSICGPDHPRAGHRGAEAGAPAGGAPRRRRSWSSSCPSRAAAPTWPGVTTRAIRDGDVFILNGSKIWSSGAYAADYALCLARTDWEAPKHRGLTMFLVKVHQPGVDDQADQAGRRQRRVLPGVLRRRRGPRRRTWSARSTAAGRSPRASSSTSATRSAAGRRTSAAALGSATRGGPASADALIELVRRTGQASDPRARELVAEAHLLSRVQEQLIGRVAAGMRAQQLPPPAGAIIRLFAGMSDGTARRDRPRAGRLARGIGPALPDAGGTPGDRRSASVPDAAGRARLGGGSTEMARNIISERVLGMPREYAADRDIPFSQVRQGRR